ncbi:O-antigen ligase family protein [Methylotenera sp.]|uniref:O-antigen ligase family protein n=1 Tax=Methylotenera sp. TaxID=2051956 RepID=UPI00248A236B|nr:O-antigen ligase family protein [Methylotenera sp.]MDI1360972.1 O-antigen ligase family protein [Methylotenera sp.]
MAKSASSMSKPIVVLMLLGMFIAIFFGIFVAYFGSAVGDSLGLLVALPMAMVIGFLFLFDRYSLLLLIMLSRASLDVLLDNTRFGSFGLGAVLNALVIFMAIIAIIQHPIPARKVFCQTWLSFLLIALMSIFFAPEKLTALKYFLVLLSFASTFVLAIVLIKSEEDYGRWIKAVLLSSVIPVIYGFIDLANGGYNGQESEGLRISSTFSHPNVFAFYLVLMISLSFYCYKTKAAYISVFIRRTLPIYIFILLALLVLTKTRTAWVSCAAFFTMYALIYERKYLLYILLAPILAFMIPEVRDRLLDLGQGNQVINYSKLNSYAWRKLIWHDGLSFMSRSHYFFGYGLEAFKERSVDFFTMSGGKKMDAHSVYVQLFFETGIFGLVTYIWLHIKTATLLAPFYKKNKLMIFTMIMLLLEFAFEAYADNMLSYLSYIWYMWFVLGAVYAVNTLKPIESPAEAKT